MTVADPLHRAIRDAAELEVMEALVGEPIELSEFEQQRRALLVHIKDQAKKLNQIRDHVVSHRRAGEDYMEIEPALLIIDGWLLNDL